MKCRNSLNSDGRGNRSPALNCSFAKLIALPSVFSVDTLHPKIPRARHLEYRNVHGTPSHSICQQISQHRHLRMSQKGSLPGSQTFFSLTMKNLHGGSTNSKKHSKSAPQTLNYRNSQKTSQHQYTHSKVLDSTPRKNHNPHKTQGGNKNPRNHYRNTQSQNTHPNKPETN